MTLPTPPTVMPAPTPDLPWDRIAARVRAWAQAEGLAIRDVIVLLPFAQLLAPARDAFASAGVWMPRIETTRTLRASLGPPPVGAPGALRFEGGADELAAMQRLAGSRAAWAAPRDAAPMAAELVVLAQGLARAMAAWPPSMREAETARRRSLLGTRSGPGADEQALARLALDWAAESLFAHDTLLWSVRPAGWVVVQAGGADPLAQALAAAAGAPVLTLDLDAEAANTLDAGRFAARQSLVTCAAFEDEAQAAAAEVIATLRDGQAPVALIAQDRVLTRRIRALLEQRGIAIADETGWRLSTTRAAACVTALLDAAHGDPVTDVLIDAIKSIAPWRSGPERPGGATALESICRRRRLTRRSRIEAAGLEGPAAAAFAALAAALAPLRRQGPDEPVPLAGWLEGLAGSLAAAGVWEAIRVDAAGRAVIDVLGLEPDRAVGRSLRALNARLDAAAFRRWVDRALETATFVPPPPARPEVVLLPLERAMLRPFAAIVFPGADERQLGGPQASWPWLGDRLAAELGLPTLAQRQEAQWFAVLQLLRMPQLVWLYRRQEAGETLGPSRSIERIEWIAARHGRSIERRTDRRETVTVTALPVLPGTPRGVRLPAIERLSATTAEALRDCPYRFFALHRLRLTEERELDDEVAPNDFGNWAHRVLYRFHAERTMAGQAEAEVGRLIELAAEIRDEQGLDAAAFVPFADSFAALAPRYIAWLHAREAGGWRWQAGEVPHEVRPAALGGVALQGVIDRIDANGASLELIDYKTGGRDKLVEKLRNPFEDTQLAFYAALLGEEARAGLSARYLLIGKAQRLDAVEHPQVERSAAALVQGLGDELARLAAGAPMPPLGEGASCEYCAARGLCRRDHWWQRP
jgi:ATP-dependent helicase/nuclease subunit B